MGKVGCHVKTGAFEGQRGRWRQAGRSLDEGKDKKIRIGPQAGFESIGHGNQSLENCTRPKDHKTEGAKTSYGAKPKRGTHPNKRKRVKSSRKQADVLLKILETERKGVGCFKKDVAYLKLMWRW